MMQAAFLVLSLTGVLLDPSNATVPGATVLLRQGAAEWTAATGPAGEFRFENLAPGNYALLISIAGFDPVRRPVRVGAQPPRPMVIRLKLADLKQEVTVAERHSQVSIGADRNAGTISVERSLLDTLPILDNN